MRDHTAEKVMVAYPYGHIEPRFVRSLIFLLKHDHDHHDRILGGGAFLQLGTTNVAHGRNQIVCRFLDDTAADWLWFIDTDMDFPPDTLDRLVESADPVERPIMGALCFALMKGDAQEVVPTMYGWDEDEEGRVVPTRHLSLPSPDGVYPVSATGAGCVLIHRSALEGVAAARPADGAPTWAETSWPWFRWSDWTPGGMPDVMGEDLTFCFRAGAAGFPTHVDTRIKVGHVKPVVIDEGTFHAQFGATASRPRFVVVPIKDRRDLTESLLRQLAEQGECDRVFLLDNGSNRQTKNWLSTLPDEWRVTVIDAEGWGIHQCWNAGIRAALAESPRCDIAILNNDLELGPRFLSGMSAALASDDRLLAVCPNYDRRPGEGVLPLQGISAGREDGTGGLSGFAFMVRGEMFSAGFPLFDEAMRWYCGDLDLCFTIESLGGWYGMAAGVEVVHVGGGSQTASAGTGKRLGSDDLRAQAEADEAYFSEKWGVELRPAS